LKIGTMDTLQQAARIQAWMIIHDWLVVSTPRRKKPIIIGIITPKFVEQMTCLKPPNTWQHYLGTLLIIRKVDQLGWSMRCLAGDQDLVIPADIRNCRVGLSASGPRQSQDIKIHWIYLVCTKYLATTLDAMDNQKQSLQNNRITGWWYTYPSEKYEFVSWDDDIPNIWENKIDVQNHQPVIGCMKDEQGFKARSAKIAFALILMGEFWTIPQWTSQCNPIKNIKPLINRVTINYNHCVGIPPIMTLNVPQMIDNSNGLYFGLPHLPWTMKGVNLFPTFQCHAGECASDTSTCHRFCG